jgi:hypothetical protein
MSYQICAPHSTNRNCTERQNGKFCFWISIQIHNSRWGEEESSPEVERSNKKVENDRTPTQAQKKIQSPTTSAPKAIAAEKTEAQNEPRAAVAKPIRMEIDLSRPLTPEHKKPNDQKGG